MSQVAPQYKSEERRAKSGAAVATFCSLPSAHRSTTGGSL